MKYLKLLTCIVTFSPLILFAIEGIKEEVTPAFTHLKKRLPEWNPMVCEKHLNGSPKRVVFYEEDDEGKEQPVKQITFFETGQTQEETDLMVLEKKELDESVSKNGIPHGVNVLFYENGQVKRVAFFHRGRLHGTSKIFYPDGKLNHVTTYKEGLPDGAIISYYESGKIIAEGVYKDGKLIGEYFRYYESGEKESLAHYIDGVLDGKVFEWYENGNQKSIHHYLKGALHSKEGQPAIIIYDKNGSIEEIQYFENNIPVKSHIKYHPNERESYRVSFQKGKKDGKEVWQSDTGRLVGEGLYVEGKKVGKHWKEHENGTLAFLADYDKEGCLKEPIRNFDEQGQKIAEYTLTAADVFDSHYQTWFPNGQPSQEALYVNGELDGVVKEWYEDGTLAFSGSFKQGNKEGKFLDFFPDGSLKSEKNFKNSLVDGDQKEWFLNGKKQLEATFNEGKKEGFFRTWNEKEVLTYEGAFENDLQVGTHVECYGNGQTKEVMHFIKGKIEGKYESFYPDGQIRAVSFFKGGLLDGENKGFYRDGTLAFSKLFKDGNPVGKHEEFFQQKNVAPENYNSNLLSSIGQYDEMGALHGEQKSYYPHGAIKTVMSYEHGVLHGLKGLWDEKGNLLEESTYLLGKLEGRHIAKNPDGSEFVYHYKNNKREGIHRIYYPQTESRKDKQKAIEATYENNKLQGKAFEYAENGELISTTMYKLGVKEGPSELFHQNGQVALQVLFHLGFRQGISTQYFPDGAKNKEVLYIDDKKSGEETTYFNNGIVNSIYRYQNGELEGLAEHWNREGVLIFEGNFKAGLQHGLFKKYYDDGRLRLEQYFDEGKLDGIKKSYDMQGNLTELKYEKGIKIK